MRKAADADMTTSYPQQTGGVGDPLHSRLMSAALAAADGFHSMCLAASGGWLNDVGGAPCWYSSSAIPVFNGAVILSDGLINGGTLGQIEAFFRPRQRPYSLIALDQLIPDAARLLDMWGYSEYDFMPLMWLDGAPDQAGNDVYADRIKVSCLRTVAELETYRCLLREVFRLPVSEIELILGDNTLQIPHVRHYLGYWDGEAVGTTSLVLSRSIAGVWNVGTLPSHRKRGLATAMMRHVLSEARQEGYTASMLLASTEGLPIYARLGYTTLGTLRVFTPRRE